MKEAMVGGRGGLLMLLFFFNAFVLSMFPQSPIDSIFNLRFG